MPLSAILALLNKYTALKKVKQRAMKYTETAMEQLLVLPESPYKRALYSVTELVVDREN